MNTRLTNGIQSALLLAACGLLVPTLAVAQQQPQDQKQQKMAPAHPVGQVGTTIVCESKPGEHRVCLADTSAGVTLQKSTGKVECIAGHNWGYDEAGVWVADGCSGQFQLGPGGAPEAAAATQRKPTTPGVESWGEFEPGSGFLVGRNSAGELAISGYALLRFLDQTPANQPFTDHLGNQRVSDTRKDFYSHRIMIFFKGWLATPKLIYAITFWTVNPTDQRAIFGNIGYQFSRKFSVYGGLNGIPGSRSLQGSHPNWLGHDRVMADEFFRPYFGSGVWVQGEIIPGLWYNGMVANNNSALGVKSSQLDRAAATGASIWWMPTTKEFGPKGGYGDYEFHEKVATRFGFSTARSPEQNFADASGNPANTTLRLADSVNVFERGALTPGVMVNNVTFRVLAFDAGVKYRGVFLQTEIYNRWLDTFVADGPLPVTSVHDKGFYVQGGFYPIKKTLELYGATSQVYGDKSAGFGNSSEYLVGGNFYPFNTRNHRLNLQLIDINHSPVSSAFGYYTGGQDGTTFSAAFSVFF